MSEENATIQTELLDLEAGFWKAAGTDGAYYEQNFADDGLMILPIEGGILHKSQIIAAIKEAGAWADFNIAAPRLVQIAEANIMLVYEATGKREGQPVYRAHISSLYHRQRDGWQLAFHQQTPLL